MRTLPDRIGPASSYFLLIIILSTTGYKAAADGIVADSTVVFIEGKVAPYNALKGGDTLFLTGGHRKYLLIRNLHGDSLNPLVIINHQGTVIINTDHYFGISIESSTHIRLTGSGYEGEYYGIRIERVEKGGGVGLTLGCSDFEIDHLYIGKTMIGGLYAKTDPDCSFTNTREKFTQFNTCIHDNYFADIGNEGLYIGSTKYFGTNVNCNGNDTLLMPSLLKGVRIYNNVLQNIGWDGIQVSSASEDCRIFNNIIIKDSQAEIQNQMSGIIIGGGSGCDCYNNFISRGKGSGIEIHGIGNSKIFNNVIEFAGKDYKPGDLMKMRYGIYVTDISVIPGAYFHILFNDIISPKSDGIRFTSLISANNLIASNVVIDPGNFDFYENGTFSFKGIDSYVMLTDPKIDMRTGNNYFARNSSGAGFFPESYLLKPDSPLIDAGWDENTGITFDFLNRPRPFNDRCDIGAYEFNPDFLDVQPMIRQKKRVPVAVPNPADQSCRISYETDRSCEIDLFVIDFRGHVVLKQHQGRKSKGEHWLELNLKQLPAGSYTYHILSGQQVSSGRLLIVR